MSEQSSGGIGVVGLLGVIFVTLKLCGVIGWSWWWVTCPFWGGLALVLGILLVIGIIAPIVMLGTAMCLILFPKTKTTKGKPLDLLNKLRK